MTLKEEFWREREERRQKGRILASVVGVCGKERRYFDNLAILCERHCLVLKMGVGHALRTNIMSKVNAASKVG